MDSVTADAPVNIAVVKYCECNKSQHRTLY